MKFFIYDWQASWPCPFKVSERHQYPQLWKVFNIFVCCTFYGWYDGDTFHFESLEGDLQHGKSWNSQQDQFILSLMLRFPSQPVIDYIHNQI